MTFLSFCHWLAGSRIGTIMRDSTWDFAIVEIIHLLALAVFGGAVLLVDLRFLGVGLRMQPIAKTARELLPLTGGGVIAMLISGFLLVANGPVRYYYNPAFRIKMALFVFALSFHFIVQIAAARRPLESEKSPVWLRVSAVLSLFVWLSIGIAGRAIGYV
ncbi:putative membrane protein [Acidisarcina polymorpha]|uniref:Putative membrane protein n=1 Tax=Acidisarcina polymorpha TaxID=2211140 RepID=A0A2Z5FYC8_9BACT|nr:DUF6644 family protein [Acidisarcina polymorpha]AXC11879.1 putative membrane protein [Acidisarcina polymorpha]